MAPQLEKEYDTPVTNERTSLLTPSQNLSGSRTIRTQSNSSLSSLPLVSSLQDVQEMEMQLHDALSSRDKKANLERTLRPYQQLKKDITQVILLLVAGALVVVLISISTQHPHHGSDQHHQDNQRHQDFLPFSTFDPVRDLKLYDFKRPEVSSPPPIFQALKGDNTRRTAIPTNTWYQNMLLPKDEPSNLHRAFAVPYLVDAVGPIPGLQIHPNHVDVSTNVMQVSFAPPYGLTLGAKEDALKKALDEKLSYKYSVQSTTELGLTLGWDILNMSSPIIHGMAYATMSYGSIRGQSPDGNSILPTIASLSAVGVPPIADGSSQIDCFKNDNSPSLVEKEIEISLDQSDFTWLIFFSEPVFVQCVSGEKTGPTYLQVVQRKSTDNDDKPLLIRSALLDECATGRNRDLCTQRKATVSVERRHTRAKVFRKYANYYPGPNSSINFSIDQETNKALLTFDWDARDMTATNNVLGAPQDATGKNDSMLMYALPHHLDQFPVTMLPSEQPLCTRSLLGPVCVVKGLKWTFSENLPEVSFRAPRPPSPKFVPAIADALLDDIKYTLPEFFQRGAGDTYFSGKMLARLGRILIVAEEIQEICQKQKMGGVTAYEDACNEAKLPSQSDMSAALDSLRKSVEVWINGKAETPFVYDSAWGGVVSCGCIFDGNKCKNQAPDCPAFYDQGLNFGNGFYNDQHFHYGYHIYAAAIVAHFDPKWGREHFEQVLLLVRNIANPSKDDTAFPLYRHKDWYQGSSWASGVPLPPYLNGKNQESSSEAIASYEAVALFGTTMAKIWDSAKQADKANISREIHVVGQLLTATEIRSAKKYWHVLGQNDPERIYPSNFKKNVVGIMWSTMAQFGTWFGAAEYLPYGIQLLPLTPISEERDSLDWAKVIYKPFSEACEADYRCTEQGWSVLELAIQATIGQPEQAMKKVDDIPDASYESAGGNGHSKSNTLWYIATRPAVDSPISAKGSEDDDTSDLRRPPPEFELHDCYQPDTCTSNVLDRMANGYSCRDRINWLIESMHLPQYDACAKVAFVEHPSICGPCDPSGADIEDPNEPFEKPPTCPPCTEKECNSDLNRCPIFDRTFVCTDGPSFGGCDGSPWDLGGPQCNACCEMTKCKKHDSDSGETIAQKQIYEGHCPPCSKSVVQGQLNACQSDADPYLCLDGGNTGGCSSVPWNIQSPYSGCTQCCKLLPE